MATDIKKFLDQSGVSTLWSRVAAEVKKVDDKAAENAAKIATMEGQIEALEAGTYDDSAVRSLIANNTTAIDANKTAHEANAAAIAVLNDEADVVGSVKNTANAAAAAEVAKIVANADTDFDTLKEIADWILNDTTGAADMANDIAALEAKLAGIDATVVAHVATAIESALKVDGADKYALASDLTALANRVKTLEDAGYQNAEQVGSAIDAKIIALNLATTYEAKGAAAQALADAKSYTDTEVAKIQALTEAEIDAAIGASIAQDANQTLY